MEISGTRLALCKAYLDDCYDGYGGEINAFDHTIAYYLKHEIQASYSVMYFAKSVGLWWGVRDMLGVDDDSAVVSIGAGPLFCVMGWFFGRPPVGEQMVCAVVKRQPFRSSGQTRHPRRGGPELIYPATDGDRRHATASTLPAIARLALSRCRRHATASTLPAITRVARSRWS